MNNLWMGNKGRLMLGGNSSSPQVQQGRRDLVTSRVMSLYGNAGGKYIPNVAGRPTIPTEKDDVTGEVRPTAKWRDALVRGLNEFGDENIGAGMSGRNAAATIVRDELRFRNDRQAEQDRQWEMEQREEIRRQNKMAEEARQWTRKMWENTADSNGGGFGGGSPFGVRGLR